MIKALILIGGKSRRMGFDKSLLQFYGKPQYEYIMEVVEDLGIPAFLSVNSRQAFDFPDTDRVIPDDLQGIGPLGGLAAALSNDPEASWLLLACDMPFVNAASVTFLTSHHQSGRITTFQSENKSYPEVLFTIYDPSVRPMIQTAIKEQSYSLQSLLKQFPVIRLSPVDPQWLLNVNNEEDLQHAIDLIRSSSG